MTQEQQAKFRKWLNLHIKEYRANSLITFNDVLIEYNTDEHEKWLEEKKEEFYKQQPPKAGVVYVPWIIETTTEDEDNDRNKDRSAAVELWESEHSACPKCLNENLMHSLAGVIWNVGQPYVDNINTAYCSACNWTGKVNQLKPKLKCQN